VPHQSLDKEINPVTDEQQQDDDSVSLPSHKEEINPVMEDEHQQGCISPQSLNEQQIEEAEQHDCGRVTPHIREIKDEDHTPLEIKVLHNNYFLTTIFFINCYNF
jgi:hypothetical protein